MSLQPIRPICICLFRSSDRILVSTYFDSTKDDHFSRPLGGGIEFGENSHDAMRREIDEEIGLEIQNLRLVNVLESLFVFEGQPRHEIVFVYDAEFKDDSLYHREGLECYEHAVNAKFTAQWMTLEEIAASNSRLVPDGLAELLGS